MVVPDGPEEEETGARHDHGRSDQGALSEEDRGADSPVTPRRFRRRRAAEAKSEKVNETEEVTNHEERVLDNLAGVKYIIPYNWTLCPVNPAPAFTAANRR